MDIDDVKKILNGEVLRVPTDTVYGYVCDAKNKMAIDKIYEMKKRDKSKPLGIFVDNINKFYEIVDGGEDAISDDIKKILNKNWPGALTVICKKRKGILDNLNEGIDTIGVRIPNDKNLLALMKELNTPLAQTSANISGEKDVSSSKIGNDNTKASTIIDIADGKIKIIREGDVKI